MNPVPEPAPRTAVETKARIALAAQDVFATKGYSHAGLREIAALCEVAPSLIIKHFGSKARLFEEALAAAIVPIRQFQQDRSRIGEAIVASVLDPESRMLAPAMIALAVGDPESRSIAEKVVTEQIVSPMAEWLGTADAREKAISILAMTTGFSIHLRNMDHALDDAGRRQCGVLFARAIQEMVDRDQVCGLEMYAAPRIDR